MDGEFNPSQFRELTGLLKEILEELKEIKQIIRIFTKTND
jgi:hypothetical protein